VTPSEKQTRIELSVFPSSALVGDTVTISGMLEYLSGSMWYGIAGATVSLYYDSTKIADVTTTDEGIGKFSTTYVFKTAGTYTIKASYPGLSGTYQSCSATATVTISAPVTPPPPPPTPPSTGYTPNDSYTVDVSDTGIYDVYCKAYDITVWSGNGYYHSGNYYIVVTKYETATGTLNFEEFYLKYPNSNWIPRSGIYEVSINWDFSPRKITVTYDFDPNTTPLNKDVTLNFNPSSEVLKTSKNHFFMFPSQVKIKYTYQGKPMYGYCDTPVVYIDPQFGEKFVYKGDNWAYIELTDEVASKEAELLNAIDTDTASKANVPLVGLFVEKLSFDDIYRVAYSPGRIELVKYLKDNARDPVIKDACTKAYADLTAVTPPPPTPPTVPTGNVVGHVYEEKSKKPIVGVKVGLAGKETTTNSEGYYEFKDIPEGNQLLAVYGKGTYDTTEAYFNASSPVTVVAGQTVTKDMYVLPVGAPPSEVPPPPSGKATVKFVVYDSTTKAKLSATILIANQSYSTDANGEVTVTLDPGDYDYSVSASGYYLYAGHLSVQANQAYIEEVAMVPIPPTPPSGKVSLTIGSSLGGTTDPTPGIYTYDKSSKVTLTATPGEGYSFSHWLINNQTFTQNPITITLDQDTIAIAYFSKKLPLSEYLKYGVVAAIVAVASGLGLYFWKKRKR
jgi:hypothetical protein